MRVNILEGREELQAGADAGTLPARQPKDGTERGMIAGRGSFRKGWVEGTFEPHDLTTHRKFFMGFASPRFSQKSGSLSLETAAQKGLERPFLDAKSS